MNAIGPVVCQVHPSPGIHFHIQDNRTKQYFFHIPVFGLFCEGDVLGWTGIW